MSNDDTDNMHETVHWPDDNLRWAKAEIERAARRHPEAAGRIREGLALLRPTHPLMEVEMVYRSHCAEILDRVARHDDARPATAAECALLLSDTSQQGPLGRTGMGLYLRTWRLAGLIPQDLAAISQRYETMGGEDIEEQEILFRRRFGQSWRLLPGEGSASPAGS